MHLYALYGLRGSVGVLRVQKCEYSHLIAFNFCTLKFCNHARTDQQDRHPDNCARIPYAGAWRKIRTPNRRSVISGIYAICRRSATDQRKRSARARTGPGIDHPRSSDRWRLKNRHWNCEIVKFPDKICEKIFWWSWEYLGNIGAFKFCQGKI